MKVIRIKGLLALLLLVISAAVLLLVVAAPAVRMIMQSQLTAANGAEVNIDAVEINYLPFKLVVSGIQATDSEKPEENLIEIDRARLEIKSDSLLKGKFIITDMSVDNIRFATKRDHVGKILSDKAEDAELAEVATQEPSMFTASAINLPDVNELMDKADLQTPDAYKTLEEKADETKQSWEAIEKTLDDKQKWDAYKSRYTKIKADYKKGNFKERLNALNDLKKLNEEIKKELKDFSVQKNKLKQDYKQLQLAYRQAKEAPGKDLDKIKGSYQQGANKLDNISQLLFNDEIAGYIALAKKYYKKMEPYLQEDEPEAKVDRAKGDYVVFVDKHPEPDFLIEKAQFSAVLPSGLFTGEASNIASDQSVQNKPAIMILSGKALKHSKAEMIKAVIDLRDKNASSFEFSYNITERQLDDYKVAGGKTLPLTIKTAKLDLQSAVKLSQGQLDANANARFGQVNFQSSKDKNGHSLSSMIAASVEEVKSFNIDATAQGKVLRPKIKIHSDIDNKINKKLKVKFRQLEKEYEEKLKNEFNQRYGEEISKAENTLKDIEQYKAKLEAKQQSLESKLNKYKK